MAKPEFLNFENKLKVKKTKIQNCLWMFGGRPISQSEISTVWFNMHLSYISLIIINDSQI